MKKFILISFNAWVAILDGITPLLLLIDAKIYGLISKLYSLYLTLAQAEIFKSSIYQEISTKVYAIMGVVSLFVIAYALLQALINPDNATKENKSGVKILKNFLIAIVLIALIPTIFDFLYSFQNSILTYNTIPKLFLNETQKNTTKEKIALVDENSNYIYLENCASEDMNDCIATIETEIDYSKTILESYGNEMAYTILSGFLSPNNGLKDNEIVVNASEYFNLSGGIKWAAIACGVGGSIATLTVVGLEVATSPATGFATLAAIPGSISAFSGAIIASCFGGAAISGTISAAGYAITAEQYTWEAAKIEMLYNGNFDVITAFNSVIGTDMDYLPIVSTLAGLLILYMVASFCLDLGLRAAKLAFYELIAPVCLLLSVIPSNKSVLSNYMKAVLTTWLEVFIRITCVCGLAYLISNLNETVFSELNTLAKSIIVMGLVMFAKQLPKLLGEVTGIKSEGMKLGIIDKLKDGGAFAVGAVIGGGITTGVRNLTHGLQKRDWKGVENRWKNGHKAKAIGYGLKESLIGTIKSAPSAATGALSGAFRSGKGGISAKNFKDMKEAASTGAKKAIQARDKREAYKAANGGTIMGSLVGHASDGINIAMKWSGINNIEYLLDEQKEIEKIKKAKKEIRTKADNLIASEANKSSSTFGVGIYTATEVRRLKLAIEDAKAGRSGVSVAQAQQDYDDYVYNFSQEIQDKALIGTEKWKNLTDKEKAKLSDIRISSEELRGILNRNLDKSYVKNSGFTASNITGDLSVKSGSTIDKLGDALDIRLTEIGTELSKKEQKEPNNSNK